MLISSDFTYNNNKDFQSVHYSISARALMPNQGKKKLKLNKLVFKPQQTSLDKMLYSDIHH